MTVLIYRASYNAIQFTFQSVLIYNMYRDILIATDRSDRGRRAADHALGLGRALDADVHALAVLTEGVTKRDHIRADPEGEAEAALESIKEKGDEKGVAVTTEIRSGDPCETIVEVAEERDVDLIVMGTTDGSRLDLVLHGSTNQCVSERSSVPVLSINEKTRPVFQQSEEADYRFYCAKCDSTLTVSTETKEALEEKGCILCGAPVSDDAFTAMEVEEA